MTDTEINEAVAKKFGYKFLYDPLGATTVERVPCYESPTHGLMSNLPNYCRDIKAAWEIVEKERFSVIRVDINEWQAGYFVGDVGPDDGATHYVDGWLNCGARADTAPMAICLAFLKLP